MARDPAREFLLNGERLLTPGLEAPEVTIPLWAQAAQVEPRVFPGVSIRRGGCATAGWIGVVNVSSKVVEVTLPLAGRERIRLEAAVAVFRGK